MGQKIHPHGLRIGYNRKWNSTWFAEKVEFKTFFYAQFHLEQFLKAFLHFYPYVKNSATKKAALVDLKWIRSGVSQLYLFIFFYKFRTKKRRWEPIKFTQVNKKKSNLLNAKKNINRKKIVRNKFNKHI